ncbi:50S ribosomal protein L29, chloroplastic [Ricinus communis]|uniref:Large ribosomal subunit protein uL29c n=1 Tax=Ricinus communis TaxID=3988 RepID=B9T3L2_RICCO|nr:50S ribosomal protein L29, chloroplastic [Ricinus communis]EEF29538.1 50S ribosomal protein L29, chloroplast precursor, putative [Ricinus communis]|eukprot:XP_002532831.1 50S ribosomal protein L29, chloroplastic [Ricinus communis]
MLSLSITSFSPKPLSPVPKSSFSGIQIRHTCSIPMRVPVKTTWSFSGKPLVITMSKRQEELKEIREMSTEQINEEVVDLKGELFMLRLQKSARNEFKSSEFRRMRKRIARMLTVKREREIEEGINKRLSRKFDRQWKKSIVVRPPPSLKKLQEEEAAAEAEKSA